MVAVHGAEQKRAEFARAAELQKIARVREFADGVLHLLEAAMEPTFQLRQRNMRNVALVKNSEWQAKFRSKLFQAHLGALRLGQHIVGRLPNGGQIIYQCARPVEDD